MIIILFIIPFLLGPLVYVSWGLFNLGMTVNEMSHAGSDGDQNGMTTGDDPAELEAALNRLKSLAAYRGESVQHPPYLHIAFLDYDQEDHNVGPELPGRVNGYRKIEVDLEFLKKSTVVFMSEIPILYEFKNGNAKQRARVGFEGVGAVDVRKAHQGLISGVRIEAFGAERVARTKDLDAVYDSDPNRGYKSAGHRRACASIRAWAKAYGAKWEDIHLWKITNPVEISLYQHKVASDSYNHDEFTHLLEKC